MAEMLLYTNFYWFQINKSSFELCRQNRSLNQTNGATDVYELILASSGGSRLLPNELIRSRLVSSLIAIILHKVC